MKIYIIFFMICVTSIIADAQVGYYKIWDRCFGGNQAVNYVHRIVKSSDNKIYLIGSVTSGSEQHIFCQDSVQSGIIIMRIDTSGNIVWIRPICGYGIKKSVFSYFELTATTDGGAIAAFGVNTTNADSVWGDKTCTMFCHNTQIWVIKIDSSGNKEWDNCFGTHINGSLGSIEGTKDGGVILGCGTGWDTTCSTYPNMPYTNATSLWLIKLDANGNMQWQKSYSGYGGFLGAPRKIIQTQDGGYLAGRNYGGTVAANDINYICKGASDYFVLKFDSLGNKQWEAGFSSGAGAFAKLSSVAQTTSGNYVLAGIAYNTDPYSIDVTDTSRWDGPNTIDYWLVMIDSTGNKVWDKIVGGIGLELGGDFFSSGEDNMHIYGLHYGGILLMGMTNSIQGFDVSESPIDGISGGYNSPDGFDIWVVKVNDVGHIVWNKRIGSTSPDLSQDIVELNDGSYILVGHTGVADHDRSCPMIDTAGLSDWWIMRFGDINTGIKEQENNLQLAVFPNPTNTSLNILINSLTEEKAEIILQNVLGQKIFSKHLQLHIGKDNSIIDVSGFAKGIYFLQIKTKERSYVRKVVKN